ncbi:hypothetical protein FQN60_017482, partial [Etheostoma spectabile]
MFHAHFPSFSFNRELFPVWVGNLIYPVTESVVTNIFNKAGVVHSVKVLTYKRCAFVNFTKQEHCDEAIRRFHGLEVNGMKIAVRYPDRIPPGMGISRSALKADDLQDDYTRGPEPVLFGGPLGAVGQVHQHLDSLGQPTQPLVLCDELGGTQGVLGRDEERSERMQLGLG